jgi:hypothetical protein
MTSFTDTFTVMKGQTFLREHVFTRVERQILAVKEGRIGELSAKDQRKVKNRIAFEEETARAARAAEAEAEAKAEAEVEKSSLGAWGATKAAVGEVEEEMAVDEATKALGQAEISHRQPWESELVDGTK